MLEAFRACGQYVLENITYYHAIIASLIMFNVGIFAGLAELEQRNKDLQRKLKHENDERNN